MLSNLRHLAVDKTDALYTTDGERPFGGGSVSWSDMPNDVALYVNGSETDDSDMDLLALCPRLASGRLSRAAKRCVVWTYADVSGEDLYRLSRPVVWGDQGVLVFFSRPHYSRNLRGWVNIGGRPSTAPLVELSWFTLVRTLWMRPHKATLGGPHRRQIAGPSYRRVFLPLMAHIRGWVRPDPAQYEALRAEASRWALHTLAAGLEAASAAAQSSAQKDQRMAHSMRPSYAY